MLKGTVLLPGDKSITHRAIIFASLAAKTSRIEGALLGEDCCATIQCFQQLGVEIERVNTTTLVITSPGVEQFQQPEQAIDCQNSGTTARLMMGILAALPFQTTLIGDESLQRRPMQRVAQPLRQMGAQIQLSQTGTLPAVITGQRLQGITYHSPVASAQVKSAILLAGLFADGETIVYEPEQSRDHTERFFAELGFEWQQINQLTVRVTKHQRKWNFPDCYHVPGDISSAAFWLVGASLIPESIIEISHVGLNPTRTGILEVLDQMGANIERQEIDFSGEPVGKLIVKSATLQAINIGGAMIPRVIDEIPIIALAATQAHGQTCVSQAEELRVKESDRITQTVQLLKQLGAEIMETADGFIIDGPTPLQNQGVYDSFGDHRLAMVLAIAEAYLAVPMHIKRRKAYCVSYPDFETTLTMLQQEARISGINLKK